MDEIMEENKWWLTIDYDTTKRIIRADLANMQRSFIDIGCQLMQVRDRELYKDGGYENVWAFAEQEFGIQRSTASRWMKMCQKFSVDGSSPVLKDEYKDFGKSQLQEMLYLEDEQLEEVTPGMTVKEIRELRAPEKKLVKPDQNQREYFDAFARHFIACKHDWLLQDFQNRVMHVDKSPVEIKKRLGADHRTWHFATDNGVAHINLFDDYVQLWDENKTHLGNFDWFYFAAALQRMWNIAAMENAQKEQKAECATSHKTGTCIHRPEFACTLPEASKIAVGDGVDCSKKCCWDCPKRMECGYRCNSAAGHPIEEEQIPGQMNVEDYPELLPDQKEPDIDIDNDEDNVVDEQPEIVINQPESVTEDDENVIDTEYKEIAAENAETEDICCQEAVDLDELTFSQIAIRDYLEEEERTLAEYEEVNSNDGGLPLNLMMRQRMLVKALRLLKESEAEQEEDDEPDEQEEPTPVHPDLPVMRNNDQRKEWLKNYKDWPVWFEVPEASEVYYRFNLPDGSSIVICEYHMWVSWKEKYSDENPDSIGTREYLLNPGYRYLHDCHTSSTALVEHLKDLQKGEKK